MKSTNPAFDVVGVGIGPFNLSVAALLQPLEEFNALFLDQRKEFVWHPGMLFPEATIQVSHLKDLVTLVDPSSRYSFLSFLHAQRRLYRFLNADFPKVLRREFNQYLRWVCASLPNLRFDTAVRQIGVEDGALVVETAGERLACRNLVLGTGLRPRVPECARPCLGESVVPAGRFLDVADRAPGRRVAVVGGGQSGAEIVYHLLSDERRLPHEVHWITRRPNFQPLDDSAFTNELFTPPSSDHFFNLPAAVRRRQVEAQKLASDGVSTELLAAISRRLYELEFLAGAGSVPHLRPGTSLEAMSRHDEGLRLELCQNQLGGRDAVDVDLVVLATGFEYGLPPYLEPISDRLELDGDGNLCFRDDYSILWDGPPDLKIFVQNAARHCRGVADPNLSLMAWRSAKIINGIAGRTVYDVDETAPPFELPHPRQARAEGQLEIEVLATGLHQLLESAEPA